MKTEGTEGLKRPSKQNQAGTKPDPVSTVHTIVDHYNGTYYCSTETVLLIFPFLQTNITWDMARWRWEDTNMGHADIGWMHINIGMPLPTALMHVLFYLCVISSGINVEVYCDLTK